MLKNKVVTKEVIRIYLFPNSFHPSWRNGLEGTCCQGKFSFNKTGQKTTLVKLFNDALVENGINATLYTQAVNSPDVNLLDLDFLRAIQSFNDTAPKNEKELIEAVSEAYDNYPHHKINQTWLTLQCCFNQIIS